MLQVGRDTNLRERKKNYLVFGFFFFGWRRCFRQDPRARNYFLIYLYYVNLLINTYINLI